MEEKEEMDVDQMDQTNGTIYNKPDETTFASPQSPISENEPDTAVKPSTIFDKTPSLDSNNQINLLRISLKKSRL